MQNVRMAQGLGIKMVSVVVVVVVLYFKTWARIEDPNVFSVVEKHCGVLQTTVVLMEKVLLKSLFTGAPTVITIYNVTYWFHAHYTVRYISIICFWGCSLYKTVSFHFKCKNFEGCNYFLRLHEHLLVIVFIIYFWLLKTFLCRIYLTLLLLHYIHCARQSVYIKKKHLNKC